MAVLERGYLKWCRISSTNRLTGWLGWDGWLGWLEIAGRLRLAWAGVGCAGWAWPLPGLAGMAWAASPDHFCVIQTWWKKQCSEKVRSEC